MFYSAFSVYKQQICLHELFSYLCYLLIIFSFVVKSEPIDLLNVAFEQQRNSYIRYISVFFTQYDAIKVIVHSHIQKQIGYALQHASEQIKNQLNQLQAVLKR